MYSFRATVSHTDFRRFQTELVFRRFQTRFQMRRAYDRLSRVHARLYCVCAPLFRLAVFCVSLGGVVCVPLVFVRQRPVVLCVCELMFGGDLGWSRFEI